MSVHLVGNSYGKSEVRLVTVRRGAERHELKDVTLAVRLEGDFAAAYTQADNSGVIATDTMKNTVYALAAEHPFDDVEDFGLALTDHLVPFRECQGIPELGTWSALGAREIPAAATAWSSLARRHCGLGPLKPLAAPPRRSR
jgi:urate oxidase